MQIGQWQDIELGARTIRFLPVCHVADEDQRHRVALSLRFTLALWRQRVDTRHRILPYHRLEPTIIRSLQAAKAPERVIEICRQYLQRQGKATF